MTRKLLTAMAFLGLVVLGLGVGTAITRWLRPIEPMPPSLEAQPASQRIQALPGAEEVEAVYELVNRGGLPLVLGPPSSSCGCSSIELSPATIPPGGHGRVVVTAKPPDPGARQIMVSFDTNDPTQPRMQLELVAVGSTPPPYVLEIRGPVQFGQIDRDQLPARASFAIDTVELTDDPWIVGATGSSGGIQIDPPEVTASQSESGQIKHYRFDVSLSEVDPGRGAIDDTIALWPASGEDPVAGVAVRGSIRPVVDAVPGSINLGFLPDEGPIEVPLTFRHRDGRPLAVEPPPEIPAFIALERRSGHSFLLRISNPRTPIDEPLAFSTDLLDARAILVPVAIRQLGRP